MKKTTIIPFSDFILIRFRPWLRNYKTGRLGHCSLLILPLLLQEKGSPHESERATVRDCFTAYLHDQHGLCSPLLESTRPKYRVMERCEKERGRGKSDRKTAKCKYYGVMKNLSRPSFFTSSLETVTFPPIHDLEALRFVRALFFLISREPFFPLFIIYLCFSLFASCWVVTKSKVLSARLRALSLSTFEKRL